MRKKRFAVVLLIFILLCSSPLTLASESKLVSITVRGADIRDVLLMLSNQSGINLVPDETVQGKVSIDLKKVEIQEALKILTIAFGYKFEKISDNAYMVSKKDFAFPAEVSFNDGKISISAKDSDIRNVIKQIADKANLNIIMDNSVAGKVSIELKNVPLELGLMTILQANGFSLSKNKQVYRIFKTDKSGVNNDLAISVIDNKVTIDVQNADLGKVLRTISRLSKLNLVLFSEVRGNIDVKLTDYPVQDVIKVILSGTRFSYRKVDDTYLIGAKDLNSPSSSILTMSKKINLKYLKVEEVPKLLPKNVSGADIKVLADQNALIITGTQSDITQLQQYIDKIDNKTPQVVVEALILEISNTNSKNPDLRLGMDYNDKEGTTFFDSVLGQLTYKSVLKLPSDFYLKIKSLVEEGKAKIKARPNITTISGHKAMIDVGTVQYYKTIKVDDNGNEAPQYQSINAGITLQVTPWVGGSKEITMDLKPSVSNIVGAASAEQPPNIGRREIDTTVRVKDGETLIIGGLIQDVSRANFSKVPVLGDLPVVGPLFKSRQEDQNRSELVIYITPHILQE